MFSSTDDAHEFLRVVREAQQQLRHSDSIMRNRLLDLCLNISTDELDRLRRQTGYPRRLLLRFLLVASLAPVVIYCLLAFLSPSQAPVGA